MSAGKKQPAAQRGQSILGHMGSSWVGNSSCQVVTGFGSTGVLPQHNLRPSANGQDNKRHKLYCGIDLHARKMYVCIIDARGKTKNDKIDSCKIAKLLMGGNLPFLSASSFCPSPSGISGLIVPQVPTQVPRRVGLVNHEPIPVGFRFPGDSPGMHQTDNRNE
jgi:hypothetical protein